MTCNSSIKVVEKICQGTDQIQAFIQYVDAYGDSADLKWDSKPAMCLPFEFTKDYVKAELNQ